MNNNPDDFLNMARAAGVMRGSAARRFDEYYRCYPMVMAPGPERTDLNYGSKILLPPSALDKVSKLHVQWPLLMELINGEKGRHSHAGVLEFVAEEGRAYLPQWVSRPNLSAPTMPCEGNVKMLMCPPPDDANASP